MPSDCTHSFVRWNLGFREPGEPRVPGPDIYRLLCDSCHYAIKRYTRVEVERMRDDGEDPTTQQGTQRIMREFRGDAGSTTIPREEHDRITRRLRSRGFECAERGPTLEDEQAACVHEWTSDYSVLDPDAVCCPKCDAQRSAPTQAEQRTMTATEIELRRRQTGRNLAAGMNAPNEILSDLTDIDTRPGGLSLVRHANEMEFRIKFGEGVPDIRCCLCGVRPPDLTMVCCDPSPDLLLPKISPRRKIRLEDYDA